MLENKSSVIIGKYKLNSSIWAITLCVKYYELGTMN